MINNSPCIQGTDGSIIPMKELFDILEKREKGRNILIFDCCLISVEASPKLKNETSSTKYPSRSLICFSTTPNGISYGYKVKKLSYFTHLLLNQLNSDYDLKPLALYNSLIQVIDKCEPPYHTSSILFTSKFHFE